VTVVCAQYSDYAELVNCCGKYRACEWFIANLRTDSTNFRVSLKKTKSKPKTLAKMKLQLFSFISVLMLYAAVAGDNAGSCLVMDSQPPQVYCAVDKASCGDRNWYAPGFVSKSVHSPGAGCCHCCEGCDHTKETPGKNCTEFYVNFDGECGHQGGPSKGSPFYTAPTSSPTTSAPTTSATSAFKASFLLVAVAILVRC